MLTETENNPEVRLAVIGSLSSFTGSSDVAEKLISLLSNTDEQVRINVISSLGYLGNKMAIAPLKELLNETTNSRIREFMEYALQNLGAL